MAQNVIYGINGPVVTVKNATDFSMQEMVYVGNDRLIGEVIGITDGFTTIQVYEVTTGLRPGEPVHTTGTPMSVTLGPGIIKNIFDGIERPLKKIEEASGAFIDRGCSVDSLDTDRGWDVTVCVREGDVLSGGEVYATCPETSLITHKCLVPPDLCGRVVYAAPNGSYHINDKIAELETEDGVRHTLTLCQRWPIRIPRPVKKRLPPTVPLITGQRVIDTLFPLSKGGTAAIPGGFGTGKTMTQHQLAKWCDADIIIYVGCGERGNEMTQVLEEFSELIDPKSGKALTDRTVLIANTSNMPVAAREASIYTGITLAEYYRDMGYHVAMMADSTSRWAEALREMSGRLEEMPGEEGYPAYLGSRLAQFYERAGRVITLGDDNREGALSVIGAVSPPGGDISEPVSQATLRIVKVFWGLDSSLAYKRHFPAVNWLTSYSLYVDSLADWFKKEVAEDWIDLRQRILSLLQEEAELEEIVKLVGMDALSPEDRLKLEASRSIREDYLHQDAFHEIDTYASLKKQYRMMEAVLNWYDKALEALRTGADIEGLVNMPAREKVGRIKYVEEDGVEQAYQEADAQIDHEIKELFQREEDA